MASCPAFPLKARVFPSSGFEKLNPTSLVEEEEIPNYRPEKYYPARIGEVVNSRYQVVAKLGYGASSTVWLCRDLEQERYVAIKCHVITSREQREVSVLHRLNKLRSDLPSKTCLRLMLESFEIEGPNGTHMCLVHEPQGLCLFDVRSQLKDGVLSRDLLRYCARQLFGALDYLHTEAHLVHADVQPNNMLMGFHDKSVLVQLEQDELDRPIPRKILSDRVIYISRPLPMSYGPPKLCDFGEARSGEEQNCADIMPDAYRAPEVILGMNWSYPVDIWGAAMTIWDLFEGQPPINGINAQGKYDDGQHLAQMIAVLGPPPTAFLQRSENCLRFWDENGKWRGLVPIPDISFKDLENRLEGDEKASFLELITAMLDWIPEHRPSAEECIQHPWIIADLKL